MILDDNRIAKNRLNSAQVSVISMELFIIETLLNGRSVVIPDFGHLELKSFGDRRTVFFKSTNGNDSLLRIMSVVGEEERRDANVLNTLISIPLKEGKIVNLPQIGIFRPIKREDGKCYISFLPSSSLRKLLNEEDVIRVRKDVKKEVDITPPDAPERKEESLSNKLITDNKISDVMGDSRKLKTTKTLTNNNVTIKNASDSIFLKKNSHLNDIIVSQDKASKRIKMPKNKIGIFLLIVAIIAFTSVAVWAVTDFISRHYNNKVVAPQTALVVSSSAPSAPSSEPSASSASSVAPSSVSSAAPSVSSVAPSTSSAAPNALPSVSTVSSDLPSLSKQYYGHPAFWIYIYEANLGKLDSPINIPKNVSLIIPDLKAVYGVDASDNMEIQRAKIRADIFLKDFLLRKKIDEMNNK